jgi:uncharacterized protein YjlB
MPCGRKPNCFYFADDGETPNNPKWPLVIYRSPVQLRRGCDRGCDPAAILEDLFASNGWRNSWRDGIYDFLHFHTQRNEVLGIARGHVEIAFGGRTGKRIRLNAGDVAILPAGTGHKRVGSSRNLLVVGAYPQHSGRYDQPRPSEIDHKKAAAEVARVRPRAADPAYGSKGPLIAFWQCRQTG